MMTQLLQRLEHVVDNRFISNLGSSLGSGLGNEALAAHSLLYPFFLVGQALGLASATSALIFWRREGFKNSQWQSVGIHLALGAGGTLLCILAAALWAPVLFSHFSVAAGAKGEFLAYFLIGLANTCLQGAYAPLNAMLIASDRRMTSLKLVAGILLLKLGVGALAGFAREAGLITAEANLFAIALGTTAAVLFFGGLGWRELRRTCHRGEHVPDLSRSIRKVWVPELGVAAIRSVAPLGFAFQIATIGGGGPQDRMIVTFQMLGHLSYLLALPFLAGAQIALRDASAQQSRIHGAIESLSQASWFSPLFWAALMPAAVGFVLCSVFPAPVFEGMFGYSLPQAHGSFVSLYLLACVVGQLGNVHVLRLRSAQKNAVVTRNFLVSEIGVQLGLTQALIALNALDASRLGWVIVAYCCTHLILNWASAERAKA